MRSNHSSARNIGWDRLETSIALFLRNHHLKRGVHLNDISRFIVYRTVKELPQIANKNGFNFAYGNHRFFCCCENGTKCEQNSYTFYRHNPELFDVKAHIVYNKYSALNKELVLWSKGKKGV
jgi:hypothetical protein